MESGSTGSKVKLIEETLRLGLGRLSADGALVVDTGKHTGRAAKDKYIVRRPETENTVDWASNQAIPGEEARKLFDGLHGRLGSSKSYRFEGYVGGFRIDVHSLSPWHVAFAANMFRSRPLASLGAMGQNVRIVVLHDPFGKASDYGVKVASDTAIVLDPAAYTVGIVGTAYAGEIKKSAFSLCNYLMPEHGIFPMHAGANCLEDGSASCVLFGLSGTGKTTLSAAPDRFLVGDDEIIWSESGLSNLEGGCYAKLINLDPAKEPEIHRAVTRFGAILENIGMSDDTRKVDYADGSRTENTRGSYPMEALERVFHQDREASAPRSIVFLTADAFGAMPAVARLDSSQAQYHFLSGYTAKVAGTEMGVKEPQAAFSACFGAPFMPRHPAEYASLLARFAERSGASVWILNTGWTKGGYGKGPRFPISVSRQLLRNIQSGELDRCEMREHPVFGFRVPVSCPGVEPQWLELPEGPQVQDLAAKFAANIRKYEGKIAREVIERGGPRVSPEAVRAASGAAAAAAGVPAA